MASVYLNTLKPGDLIYAGVVINRADTCAYPGSQTSKFINEGRPIRHPCVVLQVGTASVQVAYFATFKESLSLPSHLDVNMWYPVYPAPQQG
ncbi:hypothetical protein EDD15DRAFT_2295783 [Pisolithus albus]|nr:hypothetical protein EDD15DRAFT_2295783 [Pisolithus albus]